LGHDFPVRRFAAAVVAAIVLAGLCGLPVSIAAQSAQVSAGAAHQNPHRGAPGFGVFATVQPTRHKK
jgi:hypothetical protein